MSRRRQHTFPWNRAAVAGDRSVAGKRRSRAPRMAPSAVRIPDPRIAQVELRFAATGPQIFIHEGARQALERRFEQHFGRPVQLAVTDNRQSMITETRERSRLRVRVHMMFLDAPEHVQEALVHYVVDGDRAASQVVGEYIGQNSHRIRACRPVTYPLRTRGEHHDLVNLLGRLSETYFGGGVQDLLITWGRRTRPTTSRSTIKLGSYSATERLIRIHPVLDKKWVPRYFVSYVIYHEMLHHVVPPVRVGGRSLLHPPEFLRRERQFRHYERALQWESTHIARLLRG